MATRQGTRALNTVLKKLEKVLSEQYEASAAIKRIDGGQIGIPDHMTVADAKDALEEYLRLREEVTDRTFSAVCHPNDGLVAFYNAMKGKFGMLLGHGAQTLFSRIPGEVTVDVGYNETVSVPYGEISIPGMKGIKMEIAARWNSDSPLEGRVDVYVTYRRKYEPLIRDIEEMWRKELSENSIFKGKAIDSAFEFIDLEGADTSKIVYTADEWRQLEANVFTPLEHRKAMEKAGIPLKRTVLLYGPFGTGKTLTALKAAQSAVANGWTFMMVRTGHSISAAIQFARQFQPAAVFFEDVDVETAGERGTALNDILNTVDGMLSKNSQVLTILTTNRLDRINRAMLRPGRIDSLIRLGELTQDSVVRLVKAYAGDSLVGELDADALFGAAKGYVPAFVANAVERAGAYSIARSNGQNGAEIVSEDVVAALNELRPQFEVMMGAQTLEEPTLDRAFKSAVEEVLQAEPA